MTTRKFPDRHIKNKQGFLKQDIRFIDRYIFCIQTSLLTTEWCSTTLGTRLNRKYKLQEDLYCVAQLLTMDCVWIVSHNCPDQSAFLLLQDLCSGNNATADQRN
ncbi:hypothetical protein CS542_07135 [Pedobacter sp. IW39]|nr:hypothetical protein CS542_07135 [Pedobacter sp. IW39]